MIAKNFFIKRYTRKIVKKLIKAGFSDKEIALAMIVLDNFIYGQIAKDLLAKLKRSDQERLDRLLDEHADDKEIIQAFGIDKDELTQLFIYKLEDYLAKMDKNLQKPQP